MNNPNIEEGSIKEQTFIDVFLQKEREDYLETMMLVKASQGQDISDTASQYFECKFPWNQRVKRLEEEEAADILEEETKKAYKVKPANINKKYKE